MSEFFAIIKPERKIFVLRDGSSSFTLTSPGERETIDHDGVIYFYRGIVGGIAFYSSSEPQHNDEDVETSFEATTVLNTGVSMIDLVKAGALIAAEIDRRLRAGQEA